MFTVKATSTIDCKNLPSDEINKKVVETLQDKYCKHVVLKNVDKHQGLLEGIKTKKIIEVIGNPGSYFANSLVGVKVIVDGNVGEYSCGDAVGSKFSIWGSSGSSFGCSAGLTDFYVRLMVRDDSFFNLSPSVKVAVGEFVGKNFARNASGGNVVMLNIKDKELIIDDDINWLEDAANVTLYLRGQVTLQTNRFFLRETNEEDEDVYLPLISEFVRLFNLSLSGVKSKPFYKLEFSKQNT